MHVGGRNVKVLLAFVASCWLAGVADAHQWAFACQNTTSGVPAVVGRTVLGGTDSACWNIVDADSDNDESPAFTITSPTALICLDSDTTATANGASRVQVRRCSTGTKPSTNPSFSCFTLLTTVLDGTEGSPAVQNACLRVGPGVYYLVLTTDPAGAGDPATVHVQAEGGRRR
ncbi:hypothetical protein LCGC14_1781690 [marine sediment metagenome]|uniref:Uncharacterized protein n=1 Tax=marine sediment metagenome TaxID=412755 RepID=A0A0F9JUS2_9ZZZZ